jgi:hypothetical protein
MSSQENKSSEPLFTLPDGRSVEFFRSDLVEDFIDELRDLRQKLRELVFDVDLYLSNARKIRKVVRKRCPGGISLIRYGDDGREEHRGIEAMDFSDAEFCRGFPHLNGARGKTESGNQCQH